MNRFTRRTNFHSLSVRDLLETRDMYHAFLANLENVVGTAIGLFRIRRADPDAENYRQTAQKKEGQAKSFPERNLANTVVRPWSWPCIYVFVEKWEDYASLAKKPEHLIPPFLYLPDGRAVPTCVIYTPHHLSAQPPLSDISFPDGMVGGGYPILSEEQGEERIGTMACLVHDGQHTYALTNHHVSGAAGTILYTLMQGERRDIGRSFGKGIGKIPFRDAYPDLPGQRTFVHVDAGLIYLNELEHCTAQVYGIGPIGEIIDLHSDTISLDLIGCPVCAFAGISGKIQGEIQALFYRYKTVGGFDYVADFLIGPRSPEKTVNTRPGDSGALWFWERSADEPPATPSKISEPLRPIALQWGGHSVMEGSGQEPRQFALATGIATILRLLDVELVRDWETGHSEYWGKVGHFKIAAAACGLSRSPKLKELLRKNGDRIAPNDQKLLSGQLPGPSRTEFVELADISDLVWRSLRPKDAPSHFADLDEKGKGKFRNKTLLDLWKNNKRTLKAEVWIEFYDSLADNGRMKDAQCGALPFRVLAIYEDLVEFARRSEMDKFVCAAGIMAHYVGDACQPLHLSCLHHGRKDKPEEKGIHGIYDNKMLDRFRAEVIQGVATALQGKTLRQLVRGANEAGQHVMSLMARTVTAIPPQEVVRLYGEKEGTQRVPHMWSRLQERIFQTMADGAVTLAELWESAWREGSGENITTGRLTAIDKVRLLNLYTDPAFLPVDWLRTQIRPAAPQRQKRPHRTNR